MTFRSGKLIPSKGDAASSSTCPLHSTNSLPSAGTPGKFFIHPYTPPMAMLMPAGPAAPDGPAGPCRPTGTASINDFNPLNWLRMPRAVAGLLFAG
ncbi:MAG TPA: hypothetical protein VGF13_06660 [Verrucomicrobiae bacterium]